MCLAEAAGEEPVHLRRQRRRGSSFATFGQRGARGACQVVSLCRRDCLPLPMAANSVENPRGEEKIGKASQKFPFHDTYKSGLGTAELIFD